MKGSKVTKKPKPGDKLPYSTNKVSPNTIPAPNATHQTLQSTLHIRSIIKSESLDKNAPMASKVISSSHKQPLISPKQTIENKEPLLIESKKVGTLGKQPSNTEWLVTNKKQNVIETRNTDKFTEHHSEPVVTSKNDFVEQKPVIKDPIPELPPIVYITWGEDNVMTLNIKIKKFNPVYYTTNDSLKKLKQKAYFIQNLTFFNDYNDNLAHLAFIKQLRKPNYKKYASAALRKLKTICLKVLRGSNPKMLFCLMRICSHVRSLSIIEYLPKGIKIPHNMHEFIRYGFKQTKTLELNIKAESISVIDKFSKVCQTLRLHCLKLYLPVEEAQKREFTTILKSLSKKSSIQDARITIETDLFYENLGNQNILNNFALKSLALSEPEKNKSIMRKTTNFTNFNNLETFEARMAGDHNDIINELIENAPNLKKIAIGDCCFNNKYQFARYLYDCRSDVSSLLNNISKFPKLETLSITSIKAVNSEFSDGVTIDLLTIAPISHHISLKKFELKEEYHQDNYRMLVDMKALGDFLGQCPQLEILNLCLSAKPQGFSDFFASSSKTLTNLKTLSLAFLINSIAEDGKDFEKWLGPKQKIEDLTLTINISPSDGQERTINQDFLRSITNGVGSLQGLTCLRFLYNNRFMNTKENDQQVASIQRMLKNLINLRELMIHLGLECIPGVEIKGILDYVRWNKKIYKLALGGSFLRENNTTILADFLRDESYRLSKLYLEQNEYMIGKESKKILNHGKFKNDRVHVYFYLFGSGFIF